MLYLLTAGVGLIICVLILRWWGKQPAKHRINVGDGDFRKYLKVLLKRGCDRGFMIIEAPDPQRFIQFSKYFKDGGRFGLQFDFPNAPWSTEYFEGLKSLLQQRDYDYDIQQIDPRLHTKPQKQVSEFIVVDLNQDLDRASDLCKSVLDDIFKLNATDTMTIWFMNVSIFDETVTKIMKGTNCDTPAAG
jgi:hypothetical protein